MVTIWRLRKIQIIRNSLANLKRHCSTTSEIIIPKFRNLYPKTILFVISSESLYKKLQLEIMNAKMRKFCEIANFEFKIFSDEHTTLQHLRNRLALVRP